MTLSSGQAAACRRHGLDVRIDDARRLDPGAYRDFDAVASLGAFEHFCSREEYAAGLQDEIYADLFGRVAAMLPSGGRFYLQTMTFGPRMIPVETIDIDADRDSDEFIVALMEAQFPGSFLPFGEEQVCAARSRTSTTSRASAAGSTTSRRSPAGALPSPSPACASTC